MNVPCLEDLIAEAERSHSGTDAATLRAFLGLYHANDRHRAWYTPIHLQLCCLDAVRAIEVFDENNDHEDLRRAGALYDALVRRYIQDHPGVDPPYSTQVICEYVEDMLRARS